MPAFAQSEFGVRVGVSADPTQFIVGAHAESMSFLGHVTFRPNVEVGLGNDVTSVAGNFEFVYSVPMQGSASRVYFGAGPAIVGFRGDSPRPRGADESGGGFNVLLGAESAKGFFAEFKVGFVASPEVKALIGYAFK
jgi:hypothetical protein